MSAFYSSYSILRFAPDFKNGQVIIYFCFSSPLANYIKQPSASGYYLGILHLLVCTNDLQMLNLAGLGIAFHAKPTVKDNAHSSISSIGLDGVLYLLGYHDKHIDLLE